METKTYYSKSDISISVLVGGKSVHLSFTPTSGGGSIFITSDKNIQNAIEKHHNFGRLFKLRQEEFSEKPAEKKKKGKVNESTVDETGADKDNNEDGETGAGDDTKTVITVTCPDDAKDYLADTFGVSRTTMKTVKSIKAIAESKNIEFSGI